MFNRSNKVIGHGLSFDDVLLVPGLSDINSRFSDEIDLRTSLGNIHLTVPIIAANMDSVSGAEMCKEMSRIGGHAIQHRYVSFEERSAITRELFLSGVPHVTFCIGIDEALSITHLSYEADKCSVLIDVAHGHHTRVADAIRTIKTVCPSMTVIAGNVATAEGALYLAYAGADVIKIGVGPGSLCSTRTNTGCGYPQLTAIMDIRAALDSHTGPSAHFPIIADGGIKNSGDIVKALAAGADAVMLGSLLAGTDEAPGKIKDGRMEYRGMSSEKAVGDWQGAGKIKSIEGVVSSRPLRGPVRKVIEKLEYSMRSGFSYVGARTIGELHSKARFVEQSAAGHIESTPHGAQL